MLLILMRHGIAADLSATIPSDFERPLTPEGHERTQQAAQGLRHLVPQFDAVFASPKLRAQQTAQHIKEAYGKNAPEVTTWPELMADSPLGWPEKLAEVTDEIVLLVGHEPTFSEFVSLALTGSTEGMSLDFKKAGACALDYSPQEGRGSLLWFLTPKTLRLLGQ